MTPTWQTDDGRVKLWLADCREIIGSFDADHCITDPPYGIALQNHARGKERRDMDWTIAGDESQDAGQFVIDWAESRRMPCIAFASPMKPWAGVWRQHLVWEKGEHVSGGGDPGVCWKPSWELIQVARNKSLNGRRDGAVLRFNADKEDYAYHPSPKPVALMQYLVCKATGVGDVVLDPFMGCGPTGVACVTNGRQFLGCESNAKHFERAKARIIAELERMPLFEEKPAYIQRELA